MPTNHQVIDSGPVQSSSGFCCKMASSSSSVSGDGLRPTSSKSALSRWNCRKGSAVLPQRYRASMSCLHLRSRNGSASTASNKSGNSSRCSPSRSLRSISSSSATALRSCSPIWPTLSQGLNTRSDPAYGGHPVNRLAIQSAERCRRDQPRRPRAGPTRCLQACGPQLRPQATLGRVHPNHRPRDKPNAWRLQSLGPERHLNESRRRLDSQSRIRLFGIHAR